MDWFGILVVAIPLVILFGGTALILISTRAPWKTRLRWVLVSTAPPLFMFVILAIFSPKGSAGGGDDIGVVGEMFTAVFGIAVIAANWATYGKYRASVSKRDS